MLFQTTARGRERDGTFKGGHALVGLAGGNVSLAERDSGQRILILQRRGLLQLRNGLVPALQLAIEQDPGCRARRRSRGLTSIAF